MTAAEIGGDPSRIPASATNQHARATSARESPIPPAAQGSPGNVVAALLSFFVAAVWAGLIFRDGIEVTPDGIRLRKRILDPNQRKKAAKKANQPA